MVSEYSELNGPDVLYNDARVLQKLKLHHMHRWYSQNYNLTNTTADYDPSMVSLGMGSRY